ncbi:sensor histidine kinase [Streptomyces fructofermentans]|uniref:histidine kinase n=1 Tax=Streptomyces fructofermentans TaxID=152141 RepID=A0A918U2G2_9ACTN|nr:histidine kinase [Streptomyces fructofermentans]GGX81769.1 two-component sensor histidine kinase [Streptomyces fructofermentans]
MDWGKTRRARRMADLTLAAGSAALCVTVSFAQTRGLGIYPRLASPAFPTVSVEGITPWAVAGFVRFGALGVAGSALLLWRRRWPVAVAVILIVASTLVSLIPAALVALFTVASLCSARTTAAVTVLALLPLPLYLAVTVPVSALALATTVTGGVLVAAAVIWGLFLRGLHERSEHSRTQALWRAEQIRQRERESLAREMHDVLAHRLSLLSVHAGALEVNQQVTPQQVSEAMGVIRSSAHQAMEDLQQVLGVLRTPLQPQEQSPEPPQPALADLPRLLADSRRTGMHIDLDQDLARPATVPATTARTAYRIVQEALTNAHKHAPAQPVRILLRGAPGTGLTVEITNPLPAPGRPGLPGSGSGLTGLKERTVLVGGTLTAGRQGQSHHVRADLPWPA